MFKFRSLIFMAVIAIAFTSCKDDDDPTPSSDFTVTIENAFEAKSYFDAGETGFIAPGEKASYTFQAGKGHYLSFATMFVQSNDLFYAPDMNGIPLFDAQGNGMNGDITSLVQLWDAGTEVNEEPGTGANQAPRQSGPDTGMDENGTVRLIQDVMDGFTYPANEDIIRISLEHNGETGFTLTYENVSGTSSLPSPIAPGVWVVHSAGQSPLFTSGQAASKGLEGIAEDGNNEMMKTNLMNNSGLVSPFAPGAYAVGTGDNPLWTSGSTPSAAIEDLAEDGNPGGFENAFNTPVNASAPGPIFPGDSYSFSFSAEEGDKLSLATMLVQSNDWFVGLSNIELFSNGMAISGDITDQAVLYDAGSEVDEYPGAGCYQAPRQSGANTGTDENGNVERETGTFANLPAVSNMVRITISKN